jgi:hypothetical protein
MKVYHGSYVAIENIDFSFCYIRRDFGRGFYVTKFREQADYWAKRKGARQKNEGVVTEFEFDEYAFRNKFLKVLRFEGYSNEWLDFVVSNRKNTSEQQAHDYDIVEGPVADDDITRRIINYLNEEISKEQFLSDLTYIPSHQICFCTVQSLQALGLSKYKVDSKIMNIDNEIVKALMTDFGITETEATDIHYTSTTYTHLADETTEYYLKPWTEIYDILKKELKI